MALFPTPETLVDAAANGFDLVVRGGVADLTRQPSAVIDEGPQRTVHRYRALPGTPLRRGPVLLVPPLAAPASCFDLRRGCSLAEHLLGLGYRTYLVDYGPIGFSDRALGLEHWVEDVLPKALEAVSEDAGGLPVQPVGWCLGGIMLLMAAAADPKLPVASLSLVAAPFDFERVAMFAPVRRLARLTGGRLVTALYRALGGAPAPLVSLGFRLTAVERYLTRPLFLVRNLHDRDTLAHMQAVDDYMANMLAYPGRTFGQLYHAFFRVNQIAEGSLILNERRVDLRKVRLPVLSVAGTSDVLAPRDAVHHVGTLVEGAPEVRLETAPGGHLGVLTGRGARHTTWVYLDEFLGRYDPIRAKPRRGSTARAKPKAKARPKSQSKAGAKPKAPAGPKPRSRRGSKPSAKA
jgi:polyhydroxyalkanoate synthase